MNQRRDYSTEAFSADVINFNDYYNPSSTSSGNDKWRKAVLQRFDELCAKESGWDGYHGVPVSFSTANFALELVDEFQNTEGRIPEIFSGSSGEIQLEWHFENGSIELLINEPYQASAAMESQDHEEEVQLTTNFSVINDWFAAFLLPENVDEAATA